MENPKEKPKQAITILKKGKIEILKRPYTPEQAKKFIYSESP